MQEDDHAYAQRRAAAERMKAAAAIDSGVRVAHEVLAHLHEQSARLADDPRQRDKAKQLRIVANG